MGIGEIIKAVWELPHWWDVVIVAVVDDVLIFARIITGLFAWWYMWLIVGAVTAFVIWLIARRKRLERERHARERKGVHRFGGK